MGMDGITTVFWIGLVAATIRVAVPLLLAAIGDIFTQRAGILNLGIEGLMLIGALAGFLVSYSTGSPWLGALAGMLAGGGLGLIHAWLSISVGADQIVSGIGVLILSLGLSALIHRAYFGIYTLPPKASPFEALSFAGLNDIPVLGPLLFSYNAFVYIAFLIVPISYVILQKTTFGLKITAVGENPAAAETAGVNVHLIRYACVLIGSMMAGLAGTALSLGQLNLFKEDMIAGRGFIAIAVVIFGRWNPGGAMLAALFFGLADATQIRLQVLGIRLFPPQLLSALPYLVTLLVVLGGMAKVRPPSALCIPFLSREKR